MKKLLFTLLVLSGIAHAEDLSRVKELYSPTEYGYVALTVEKCLDETVMGTYEYRAYATDYRKAKPEEGCWFTPNMEGAPKNAFPVVNIISLSDRQVYMFRQSDFTPNKPEVKGQF